MYAYVGVYTYVIPIYIHACEWLNSQKNGAAPGAEMGSWAGHGEASGGAGCSRNSCQTLGVLRKSACCYNHISFEQVTYVSQPTQNIFQCGN